MTILVLLGLASFFLPCRSYYPTFFDIFPAGPLVHERIASAYFTKWSNGSDVVLPLCLLAVFAPAMAVVVSQTRFQKNLTGLLIVSLILSGTLLMNDFGFRFVLFGEQLTLSSGYFLFMALSILGCLIFWFMSLREAWHRLRHRRWPKLRSA